MPIKMALYAAIFVAFTQPAWADKSGKQAPGSASLTLNQAILHAVEKSPGYGALRSRAKAMVAAQSQAGALPNPEISIEADNLYGDGPYKNMNKAEITYAVSQRIEMPGKRSNRVRIAEQETSRSHFTRDAAQLDLVRDITIAYAEAVAAEQKLAILSEEGQLAAAVRDSVAAKVEAGREPVIQKNKADIALAASTIAFDRAERQVIAKKKTLAALMGKDEAGFTLDRDSLPALSEPGGLDSYIARLSGTPDRQIRETEIGQAQAALALEKVVALPDPTIGLGVRKVRESDNKALVASVSFPFPVFNLNRAGIARAGHELNATQLEQRSRTLSLEAELTRVYEDYRSAYRETQALKKDVLPGAEQAFDYARGGYDAGKFGYLEVLDAQRTLFETRKQYNDAILEYYKQRASIERMTAINAGQEKHKNHPEKGQ